MNETQPNSAGRPSAAGFDPERASRLRAQALNTFQGQARKIGRYMFVWLLICMAFACVTMLLFTTSTDVKSWILFGVLFLVMIESTILIKLWYWVVNSKLAVLRQVKLLRMDLALQKGSTEALEELAAIESPFQPMGISKWERRAWHAAVMALAVVLGAVIATSQGNARFILSALSINDFRNTVTLSADGSAQEQIEWEMQNRSLTPLSEFPLSNGGSVSHTTLVPASDSPYSDALGRKLAVRREPAGLNHRDLIQFVEPVPPFARFTLKSSSPWPWHTRATREGEVWTVQETLGPSSVRIRYVQTVALPPGAEIVSVDPLPKDQQNQEGRMVLRLEAEPIAGQQWKWTVKYRLGSQP
jgi:hypothetical protein